MTLSFWMLCSAGFALHFLSKYGVRWRSGKLSPIAFVQEDLPGWISAVITTIVLPYLVPELGTSFGFPVPLTPVGAFAFGYMGSSLAAKLPQLVGMVVERLFPGFAAVAGEPRDKQGGFAHTSFLLALVLAVGAPILAVSSLSGCSTAERVAELPFANQLKLAYDVHTEVKLQIAASLDRKEISSNTAGKMISIAADARSFFDDAKTLAGTDLSSAQARLDLGRDILIRLRTSLREKEVRE